MAAKSPAAFAHRILGWYDENARRLPWRNSPGTPLPLNDPDWPYRVWLSEIMLQQTTVAAVKPYFETFTRRWPSATALAEAQDSDVMAAWAGLGYYARARNLLACARAVRDRHGGCFPDNEATLRTLPGIGDYTAAAVAAIAFGRRAVVMDGNVERVVARLHAMETPLPAAKPELKALTDGLTPHERAGDFAQAMMDLGATICTPRKPACALCPVTEHCTGRLDAERFPVKTIKKARPERTGTAWWIEQDGRVLLVRRPESGMLGGMLALPSDAWDGKTGCDLQISLADPGQLRTIRHVFTHFALTLEVRTARLEGCTLPPDAQWWPRERLSEAGLPGLFAKACTAMLEEER